MDCIPVAARGADQVIDGEREDRQMVALVVLLGLGSAQLVLCACVGNLVDELDPVFPIVLVRNW